MADLELVGVAKSYGGRPVVADTDLRVRDGAFCAMLGPSGSGKTTLLRMVAGLTPADHGRVVIGGRDVTDVPAERRNIGLVFQSYALFPHLSIVHNVAFGLRMRKVRRRDAIARSLEVLRLVGLADAADRRPAQLSGGQQQRVAVARALVIEPDLLLLDEPLSALDRKIRGELQAELKRIHAETGVTTIIVTHDQEEALDLSDHVVLLREGRIEQSDPPADLYHRPRTPFVADFLGAQRLHPARVEPGSPPTVQVGPLRLPVRDGAAVRAGDEATVAIQPEAVILRSSAAAPTAPLATVLEVGFYGSIARVRVDLDDGTTLLALALSSAIPGLAVGDRVAVEVEPAGVHVFAAAP